MNRPPEAGGCNSADTLQGGLLASQTRCERLNARERFKKAIFVL